MGIVTVNDLVSKRTNRLAKGKKVKEDKVVTIDHEEFQRSRQSLSTEELRENEILQEKKKEDEKILKDSKKIIKEMKKYYKDKIEAQEEAYKVVKEGDDKLIAELTENIKLLKKETEVRNRSKNRG